jgi:hypothetical protein
MAPSSNPSLHLNSYKRSTDPKGAPTLRTQGIGGIFFAFASLQGGPSERYIRQLCSPGPEMG